MRNYCETFEIILLYGSLRISFYYVCERDVTKIAVWNHCIKNFLFFYANNEIAEKICFDVLTER